jgi:hypothetical protein
MKTKNLLLCIVASWFGLFIAVPLAAEVGHSSFVPPDDGYDWIQLTSDELLKGELIGVFDDEIKFDSDILGNLEIDWDDIKQIYSQRTFGISIQGRDLQTGRIRIDGQQVLVSTPGEEVVIDRQKLLAITASADREIDRWLGSLTLGMNVRQGNAEFIEYNMIAGAERRTPQSRAFIDYIGGFNETEGVEVANNHRVNVAFDRFSGSRLFWRPIIGQYFRDPFQNVEHQGTLETGLGYDLMDTGKVDWDMYGAVGVNRVRRVSVEPGQPKDSTSPSYSFGTDFEIELASWIDYLLSCQMTFLDEESGSYQHHLLTTLSTDLIGDIDLDVSFVWDRTEDPPPGAGGIPPEQDDFRLLVGVGFEF